MQVKESLGKILSHRKVYFSQNGEDGLLDYILSKIPESNGWCVEFGAWDGIHLSNTYHFIKNKNYKAVLIEMDSEKFKSLSVNMAPYNATLVNKMVGFSGETALDEILSKTAIPLNFDLLSVDIDGNDYYVWDALVKYVPKVVIIEINYKDKPDIERVNSPDSPFVHGVSGTSIKSMTELAHKKGYSLVANIGCNAVYVQKQYLRLFYEVEPIAADCFTYEGVQFSTLTASQIFQSMGLLGKRNFLGLVARKVVSKLLG